MILSCQIQLAFCHAGHSGNSLFAGAVKRVCFFYMSPMHFPTVMLYYARYHHFTLNSKGPDMSLKNFLFACFSAVLLCSGCRTVTTTEMSLPDNVQTPPDYVALFYFPATSHLVITGQAELADRRFPPCSTFKIISTLMGLDRGILKGLDTRLGYNGSLYENPAWNRDVTLQEAFQLSCVPYYRKLVSQMSRSYVRKTLENLHYGNCNISVWNSNGHNVFWIESSLLISPREQVSVLTEIFSGRTDFSPEAIAVLKTCMAADAIGSWRLYGKTGTGRNHYSHFLEGWYVGFLENPAGEQIFFAAHGADPQRNLSGPEIRDSIRHLLPAVLSTTAK